MAGQHNADILNRQQHHLVFAGSHKTSMCARKLRNAISTTEEVATQTELPSCDLQGYRAERNFHQTGLRNSRSLCTNQMKGT